MAAERVGSGLSFAVGRAGGSFLCRHRKSYQVVLVFVLFACLFCESLQLADFLVWSLLGQYQTLAVVQLAQK